LNADREDHSAAVGPEAFATNASRSCRYAAEWTAEVPRSSLCVVYGDPHVRAFDGQFQTCRVVGTWPLVDNEFLAVQITNSRVGRGTGTAVSKVNHLYSIG